MNIKRYLKKIELLLGTGLFIGIDSIIYLSGKMNEKQILFLSDIRSEMGGSYSYIADALKDTDYVLITEFVPNKAYRRSFGQFVGMIKKMRSSKYIVLEDYFHYTAYMKLKRNQQICQLWHGAGAFKKFALGRAFGKEKIRIHKGYPRYSKAITSSESIRSIYADAFGIDVSKVKATGIPDTDLFFDCEKMDSIRESFYQSHPECRSKKIVLFAPTYRADSVRDASYQFDMLDLDTLYNELPEDYIFAFKWHPAAYEVIKNNSKVVYDLEKYNGFFIDLSNYRDINELLVVTDILVTDYSSVIFDYSLLNRPIVFFSYDRDDYESGRGLYFEYEKYLYGPLADTTEKMVRCILASDMKEKKRIEFHRDFMSACDGNSTKETCDFFFGE